MQNPSKFPLSKLVWPLLGALGLIAVLAGAKFWWDSESRRAVNEAASAARLTALEAKVDELQKVLATTQNASNALKSQVDGNLLTLQDVYFDTLKKNDGLSAVWVDPRPGRRAYLSFDDGPTENTALVLDALQAKKVKATFFVNGRPEWAPLYKRIVQDGHKLGNHTYSHDYNQIYQSVDAFLKDVDKLDASLAGLGLPPSRLYRFPGGAKNEIAARVGGPDMTGRISGAMADRGYRFYEWNVAVGDGESRPDNLTPGAAEITKAVLAQAKSKRIAVILLHDGPGHRASALAVPGIIDGLKKLGFSFETLP
jgi:peptidoglycan/xylan/chitin deacetylase (PgdA/CDA1 family)